MHLFKSVCFCNLGLYMKTKKHQIQSNCNYIKQCVFDEVSHVQKNISDLENKLSQSLRTISSLEEQLNLVTRRNQFLASLYDQLNDTLRQQNQVLVSMVPALKTLSLRQQSLNGTLSGIEAVFNTEVSKIKEQGDQNSTADTARDLLFFVPALLLMMALFVFFKRHFKHQARHQKTNDKLIADWARSVKRKADNLARVFTLFTQATYHTHQGEGNKYDFDALDLIERGVKCDTVMPGSLITPILKLDDEYEKTHFCFQQ